MVVGAQRCMLDRGVKSGVFFFRRRTRTARDQLSRRPRCQHCILCSQQRYLYLFTFTGASSSVLLPFLCANTGIEDVLRRSRLTLTCCLTLKCGHFRHRQNQFKPDVVLANWAIVHRLWHHTFEEFEVFLRQLASQLDGMTQKDAHRPRYTVAAVHTILLLLCLLHRTRGGVLLVFARKSLTTSPRW